MAGNEFTANDSVDIVVQIANMYGDMGDLVPRQRVETPRQTPPARAVFVDRADFREWLDGLLADESAPPRIVVLHGPPGVGKRAAARWYAHEARERFIGGDLYVEYAASNGSAADVSGKVAACLRGLGVSDQRMPATLDERVRLLRTRTAERPVLMVVENAAEPAQVRALTPAAPGSLVLVTSSADLTELRLDGAVLREMGPLDSGSSAELFRQASGTGQGTDLVRFCAGLPIAILVLAARVATPHGVPPEDLETELADERRRLSALSLGGKRIVAAVFTASYERLPEDAKHLYRRLGVLPMADISAETAARSAAIDVEKARGLLTLLADAHLLERRPVGRFAFHELIRLHAREQGLTEPREHREAALREVVRYFLVRAAFADQVIMGVRARVADYSALLAGRTDPFASADAEEAKDRARRWLGGERANLPAVVRAAFDEGWDTEAWQLAEALTGYYLNHRYLGDWTATSDLGIRAAVRAGHVRAEARLRTLVSRAYTDLGELERAGAELDAAVDAAERSGDLVLRASAWEFRGRYLDQIDRRAALDAYDRAYDLNVQAEEWRGVGLVLYFRGRTLHALARAGEARHVDEALLDKALESLRSALDRLQGDDRMSARVRMDLGAVYITKGRLDEAAVALGESVRDLAGLHYEAEARLLLADLAVRAGDGESARSHALRAWQIYREGGDPRADELAERLGAADRPQE